MYKVVLNTMTGNLW